MLPYRLQIVVLYIALIGSDNAYALPHRTTESAAHRCDCRKSGIRFLGISQRPEMATHELRTVTNISDSRREDGKVATPSHALVALRAICRDGEEVGHRGPFHILKEAIQQRVGGLVMGRDLLHGTEHHPLDIRYGQRLRYARDLYILIPMIGRTRLIGLYPSLRDIDVLRHSRTDVLQHDHLLVACISWQLRVLHLRKAHHHLCARL